MHYDDGVSGLKSPVVAADPDPWRVTNFDSNLFSSRLCLSVPVYTEIWSNLSPSRRRLPLSLSIDPSIVNPPPPPGTTDRCSEYVSWLHGMALEIVQVLRQRWKLAMML